MYGGVIVVVNMEIKIKQIIVIWDKFEDTLNSFKLHEEHLKYHNFSLLYLCLFLFEFVI